MKSIGIMVCGKVGRRCTLGGCLKAIQNCTGKFEVYDEELDLKSIIMCSYCSEDPNDFNKQIDNTKKKEIDTIHFSNCVCKCKENKLEELKDIFIKKEIKLVMGTHASHK